MSRTQPSGDQGHFKVNLCLTFYRKLDVILQLKCILVFQVVSGVCVLYTFWPSPLFKTIFGFFNIFVMFFIPLIVLVYCYGRIVRILTRRIESNLDNTGTQSEKFILARTNTVKTLLLVGLCFIICWSDNQVYYFIFNLGYKVNFNGNHYKFGILMVFFNCTINPFIYLLQYRDYQQALKHFVACTKFSQQSIASSSGISAIS